NSNIDFAAMTCTLNSEKDGSKMQMGINPNFTNLGFGYIASFDKGKNTWSILQIPHESGTRQIASRQWVSDMISYNENNKTTSVKSTPDSYLWINGAGSIGYTHGGVNCFAVNGGQMTITSKNMYSGIKLAKGDGFSTTLETMASTSSAILNIIHRNSAGANQSVHSVPAGNGTLLSLGANALVDSSGYYKKSSPIVLIYPDDHYETNDESEGAEVNCTGTGQYHITGILGYNSDGAWGVNGGISVPRDNNGLELVYV
ncbi:hypothetical protein N7387_21325, partial [Morganella sp. GD04133]|nr:hypothetical protein [Morganella sp. GD04133]